ncbi:GNAT family N-acetyltransferase [Rubrobacter indicoceani]|uniref:GNAT family N-acetyltransferase n=1 Tax=Rubrobacter indicoceani TaxID=2051957 RepID=UPI000E5AC0EC|nr:GNAT family N-acetyltransferase [Rubrobacter indicoceani]
MHLANTALEEVDGLRFRLVAEQELRLGDHAAISALLITAFPKHVEIFRTASWYPGRPDYRLWIEGSDGALVAHLNFEQRSVSVGDKEIMIAGVGGVATRPDLQGKGLGKRLMVELRRVLIEETLVGFGYLGCREEVVGFYERAGWRRIDQETWEIDPATGRRTFSIGPNLILPANSLLLDWPGAGTIDLRGMWW